MEISYFTKLKLWAWYEAYYQPEKINKNCLIDNDFKQRYFNSLKEDLKQTGKCCISKFDSVTGIQVYFTDDKNMIL
jgi:hypothetical protein